MTVFVRSLPKQRRLRTKRINRLLDDCHERKKQKLRWFNSENEQDTRLKIRIHTAYRTQNRQRCAMLITKTIPALLIRMFDIIHAMRTYVLISDRGVLPVEIMAI